MEHSYPGELAATNVAASMRILSRDRRKVKHESSAVID
jgi:hypothetical protein